MSARRQAIILRKAGYSGDTLISDKFFAFDASKRAASGIDLKFSTVIFQEMKLYGDEYFRQRCLKFAGKGDVDTTYGWQQS